MSITYQEQLGGRRHEHNSRPADCRVEIIETAHLGNLYSWSNC